MGKEELAEKLPEITDLINLILLHEYAPNTLTLCDQLGPEEATSRS